MVNDKMVNGFMTKKQYIAPQVQAMSVVTIGSVMTTSIDTPPDMGAKENRHSGIKKSQQNAVCGRALLHISILRNSRSRKNPKIFTRRISASQNRCV
jgi:hypothetical protein